MYYHLFLFASSQVYELRVHELRVSSVPAERSELSWDFTSEPGRALNYLGKYHAGECCAFTLNLKFGFWKLRFQWWRGDESESYIYPTYFPELLDWQPSSPRCSPATTDITLSGEPQLSFIPLGANSHHFS